MPEMGITNAADPIFLEVTEASQVVVPDASALLRGSSLTIVPECGHLPQQEKLDDFIAVVTAHTNGAAA